MPGRPSNLLLVSTSYPLNLSDWRGLFIRHLADALSRREDIHLNLWAPPGDIHPDASNVTIDKEKKWLSSLMESGGIAHLYRKKKLPSVIKPVELLLYLHRAYKRMSPHTDIYHINWLQNAIALPDDGKPLVIAVLGTDFQLLKLPMVARLIRRICKKRIVTICPNADWMVPILENSFGNCATIQGVPFGIDPIWYNIKRERRVQNEEKWLVVSRLTRNKIGPLFEWCEPHFSGTNRHLHLFGPMQEKLSIPSWIHYHGPASPTELSNQWFPRSKGLITLSHHAEGRPQVMLEAMASGMPVIASRLPAHENLIMHQQTGWLCATPNDFERALYELENPDLNMRIGKNARNWVLGKIGTWDDCAMRYSRIYDWMLQK